MLIRIENNNSTLFSTVVLLFFVALLVGGKNGRGQGLGDIIVRQDFMELNLGCTAGLCYIGLSTRAKTMKVIS